MDLVNLLEAVEDVQFMSLLLDHVIKVVGAVAEHDKGNLGIAQLVNQFHGFLDIVFLIEAPLVEDKALGKVILFAQDLIHILGHRIITAIIEAGVNDLHIVGRNVIVVNDRLAIHLVKGNHALGNLAGTARTALQQHALPPVGATIQGIGHGEDRREITAVKSRGHAVVDGMEGVHAMGLGRAYDALARVPPPLVVDVTARILNPHAILIVQCGESFILFVLRGIQNIIVVRIICSQCLDQDTSIVGCIVIVHDDTVATVTYYHKSSY